MSDCSSPSLCAPMMRMSLIPAVIPERGIACISGDDPHDARRVARAWACAEAYLRPVVYVTMDDAGNVPMTIDAAVQHQNHHRLYIWSEFLNLGSHMLVNRFIQSLDKVIAGDSALIVIDPLEMVKRGCHRIAEIIHAVAAMNSIMNHVNASILVVRAKPFHRLKTRGDATMRNMSRTFWRIKRVADPTATIDLVCVKRHDHAPPALWAPWRDAVRSLPPDRFPLDDIAVLSGQTCRVSPPPVTSNMPFSGECTTLTARTERTERTERRTIRR